MRKIFSIFFASLLAVQLFAVPAKPGKRTFINPNGEQVEYEVRGDEFCHYMVDANDNILEKNEEGFLRIKEKVSDQAISARRAASKMADAPAIRRAGKVNLAPRGLFILVNFKDTKYQSSNTLSAMTDMINSTGHTYNFDGSLGSVRDYFIDQSEGKYNPQFDVYGPVTVSQKSSYYAGNDGTQYAYKMVIEACQALDGQVDFSLYDGDNDGKIDFVYVIYAGKGQADGGGSSTIWPHQYYIYDGVGQTVRLDGKILNSYACGGELNGQTGRRYGIGTLCHEFGHVLGLPDYYDTNNSGYNNRYYRTPGYWHIMDAGSYNNNGITPPNYAAHDKYFLGWQTPTKLSDPENVVLPADGKTYRMLNQAGSYSATSTNVTYYFENRQNTGWDAYLPSHGMLVWKVSYDANTWSRNRPNYGGSSASNSNLCYALISADGSDRNIGTAKNPFPGSQRVTSYTPISGNALTDIAETNGTISFKFKGGVSQAYRVTFVAGAHATCATSSLTQQSVGAAITLPNVSNVSAGYKFLGWSATEGSSVAEIGNAGDRYTPSRDITLYAVVVRDGYTITFDTQNHGTTLGHGSTNATEIHEAGQNTGIVLPSFTADPGYSFQGWAYIKNNRINVAGQAGERFYPTQDITLYSYVFPSDSVTVSYDLLGVEKISGPAQGWIRANDGYTATFTKSGSFEALTAANTSVSVKVEGEEISNCASFANGVLAINLNAAQISGDIKIDIRATEIFDNCDDYSYTYTAKVGSGNKTLGGKSWSISLGNSRASVQNFNSSLGEVFGRNSSSYYPYSVTYSSTGFSSCLISSISVQCAASNYLATIEAFIEENGKTYSLGAKEIAYSGSAALGTYTFNNPGNHKGTVKFVITSNSSYNGQTYRGVIYVKKIDVAMASSAYGDRTKVDADAVQLFYRPADNKHYWTAEFYSFTETNLPFVYTYFDAQDSTSLAGKHDGYIVDYIPCAGDTIESDGGSFKFTYRGKYNDTDYPLYHVDAEWEDANHRQYYMDCDIPAVIYDYNTYQETGSTSDALISPTGDSNPVYYTVRHLQQNINDNNYTLVKIDTFQTSAGNNVTPEARSFAGFKAPLYQTKKVNSNYQTVFEYKYDRKTYQVDFVVEGTVTQSEQLRYGAMPTYKQATPTKQSYTFAGWSPNIRIVHRADTYTAQFGNGQTPPQPQTSYTVSFNANGHGNAPAAQNVEAGQKVSQPANPTAEGYTFGGWYTDEACTNAWNFESNVVNNSLTLYAKWTVNKHNLTWKANGGSLSGNYTSGQVAYGTAITAPTATRRGYTFNGWDKSVPASMPDEDLTFTAKWKRKYSGFSFVSSNERAGSVEASKQKDEYELGDEIVIIASAHAGYTFAGWSDGNTDIQRTLTIDDNTQSLVANFTANDDTKYIVRRYIQNIDNDEFTFLDEVELYGTTGTEATPEAESIEGFTAPQSKSITIDGDGSSYVNYSYTRNSYILTWNANGGELSGDYSQSAVKYGAAILAPAATWEKHTFLGWNQEIPETMPAADLTLTAQWAEGQATGITLIDRTLTGADNLHIYDFNGRDVTGLNGHLGSGLYIVVSGNQATKIFIR